MGILIKIKAFINLNRQHQLILSRPFRHKILSEQILFAVKLEVFNRQINKGNEIKSVWIQQTRYPLV